MYLLSTYNYLQEEPLYHLCLLGTDPLRVAADALPVERLAAPHQLVPRQVEVALDQSEVRTVVT